MAAGIDDEGVIEGCGVGDATGVLVIDGCGVGCGVSDAAGVGGHCWCQ